MADEYIRINNIPKKKSELERFADYAHDSHTGLNARTRKALSQGFETLQANKEITPASYQARHTGLDVINPRNKSGVALDFSSGIQESQILYERARGLGLKYSHPVAIRKAINKYFNDRKASNTPLTISGLALTLGTSVSNLQILARGEHSLDIKEIAGEKRYHAIHIAIKRAITMLSDYMEQQMVTKREYQIAYIFSLKNLGFTDSNAQGINLVKGVSGTSIAVSVMHYNASEGVQGK